MAFLAIEARKEGMSGPVDELRKEGTSVPVDGARKEGTSAPVDGSAPCRCRWHLPLAKW